MNYVIRNNAHQHLIELTKHSSATLHFQSQVSTQLKSQLSDIILIAANIRILDFFKAVKTEIFLMSSRTWNPKRSCTVRSNSNVKQVPWIYICWSRKNRSDQQGRRIGYNDQSKRLWPIIKWYGLTLSKYGRYVPRPVKNLDYSVRLRRAP